MSTGSPIPRQQLELRADWVVEFWRTHPAMPSKHVKAEMRKHFGCGKSAAEDAITRAYQIMREHSDEVRGRYLDHVVRASNEDEEESRRMRDFRAANRIRMDLAQLLGVGEPERIQLSGAVAVSHDFTGSPLTDAQLAVLASLDESNKKP